jgi:hypothetical protein
MNVPIDAAKFGCRSARIIPAAAATRMLRKLGTTCSRGLIARSSREIHMKKPLINGVVRTEIFLALTGMLAIAQGRIPRSVDGKPDLNGIWQAMNTANWDIEAHEARAGVLPVLGALAAEPPGQGVVEGGSIPYLPATAEKRKKNFENRLDLDPEAKCYLPGVPRATYMPYPFQIIQNPHSMMIAYEYASGYRNIFLKDPGEAPVDSWMGQSYGRWDGDTFVVDVTGQNDQSWFDRSGNFHSDQLHVVERYALAKPDVINYEATIEDPAVFSRPWKISMPLYRHLERNARLEEFKCVEFAEEFMYGKYRKKTN